MLHFACFFLIFLLILAKGLIYNVVNKKNKTRILCFCHCCKPKYTRPYHLIREAEIHYVCRFAAIGVSVNILSFKALITKTVLRHQLNLIMQCVPSRSATARLHLGVSNMISVLVLHISPLNLTSLSKVEPRKAVRS